MSAPRILTLDIETAPHLAYCWGLFKQNISIDKITNSGYVMCWSAKWLGQPTIYFDSIHDSTSLHMLRGIHDLLNEADIVITYNGNSFDLPTLNKEFVLHGLCPPVPYKSVDLCKLVQSTFRFASSKLDYVCKALGLGEKVRHAGFNLWVRCMEKDETAWKTMKKYNKQDVLILEKLYHRLLPWIKSHPNVGSYTDSVVCPRCGSSSLQRRGRSVNRVLSYQRFQCRECGGWLRGTTALASTRTQRVVSES